jgi:hypothetical protein
MQRVEIRTAADALHEVGRRARIRYFAGLLADLGAVRVLARPTGDAEQQGKEWETHDQAWLRA